LNRGFVRELAERWPGWADIELLGLPNREVDLMPLSEIHHLMRRMRLLRPTGRRLVATARGRKLAGDPSLLLESLATELLAGRTFEAACAELAVALMLARYSDAIAERIQPAIAADGWRSDGIAPDVREVRWGVAAFLRPAEAAGLVAPRNGGGWLSREPVVPTPVGRVALIAALRARALAPVTDP
jgi:hypothetical protein